MGNSPSLPSTSVANKVCIVTGSNTGIGYEVAYELARYLNDFYTIY